MHADGWTTLLGRFDGSEQHSSPVTPSPTLGRPPVVGECNVAVHELLLDKR